MLDCRATTHWFPLHQGSLQLVSGLLGVTQGVVLFIHKASKVQIQDSVNTYYIFAESSGQQSNFGYYGMSNSIAFTVYMGMPGTPYQNLYHVMATGIMVVGQNRFNSYRISEEGVRDFL